MKKLLIAIALLFFVSTFSHAQIGFSYLHSDVISALGISTNSANKIWAEARVGLDVTWSNASPEFIGNYNVIRRDDFDFFIGIGGRFNAVEGVILPNVGFQFKPIQSKDNFYIHAEGMYVHGSAADIFKGSVGIRYFLKRKDE